jgi:hypothetical protein
MSMFDSINKPQWQHRNPEVRKAAVDQLDDQVVLIELLNTDPDPDVRAHALSRITDDDTLEELADTLPQPLQQQARSQRLQQLLPDAGNLPSIKDDTLLIRIASLTDDPELIAASIGQVSNLDVRMELAGNHPAAKVRLCAVQGIKEIDLLQQLLHHAKHKDKAVYRYCKEQVDKHHSAERAEAELQSRIRQLMESAAELSEGVDSPEYKGRYQLLTQRWLPLKSSANPEQHDLIQSALDICAGRIAKISETQAAEEEEQALIAGAKQAFPELIAELEELDRSDSSPQDATAIRKVNETLNGIEDRWLAAMRYAQASSEQTKACKNRLNRWRAMLQTSQRLLDRKSQLEKHFQDSKRVDRLDYLALHRQQKNTEKLISKHPWPESHSSITPLPITQLHECLDRLREQQAELKKNEKKNLERLHSAFDELRDELETNHFKNADRAYNRLKQVLRKLGPDHQRHFQHELRPLVARLSEIHDWQGFAIEPKKIELCSSMRALVGSDEEPEILAGKIKALQDEWKKLGALSPRRDQALWNEFKAAADEAYKPCKEAFAKQAELRKQNFKQRMQLVAQLLDYEKNMHWPDPEEPDGASDGPDWKLVQKTLDTARETFRNIRPVDRKGERKSQKKLRAVCDRIYSHIKEEYERNIIRKQELISRARGFAELEDLQQAIEQAKRIQREWKEVGMTPVRVDRQLWKEFRAACDAVFARLDEQREQHKAEMGAQIDQAENLVKQARSLLDSNDDEQRLHLKRDLSELQAAFREIELPRSIQQQFRKRFSDMEREARNIVSEIRTRQIQQRWQCLVDRMKACALKSLEEEKAAGLWQQGGEIPKVIDAAALELFWQQGTGDTEEPKLQQACIALEILMGIESPSQDKEARMAYQMQRLVEGMGSRQVDSEQRLVELINEFIEMRPTADWMERFCRTVEIARVHHDS